MISKSVIVTAVFALSGAAAQARTIDCHQNGDGFLDFNLTTTGARSAVLITDTFHTPFADLGGGGKIDRLARLTLTSGDDLYLSPTDHYLASFYADVAKVEYLDWRGRLVDTVESPGWRVVLRSFHGASAGLYAAPDTVGYQLEVSSAGKTVDGNLWYANPGGGNSAYTCKVD